MGLSQALARLTLASTHVLTVEVPGQWLTRCALHRGMLSRGWREALSAADADVLAVCGVPGPELSAVIDRLWGELPGPRVRIDVTGASQVDVQLDRAAAQLLDGDRQRADAHGRPQRPDITTEHDHGDMDHGDMDHGDMDHGDMDHGDMDHGDMDHGDMEMAPQGIPLAQGGPDRDLLEMDTLHLRLGPVLPYWPAGLVLRCAVNGDTITDAQAWLVDAQTQAAHRLPPATSDHLVPAARECDHIRDLLAVAGWSRGAAIARRCRDLLLQSDLAGASRLLPGLQRSVRRSTVLRWSLRDVGPLTGEQLDRRGLPSALEGDSYSRLLERLRVAGDLASGSLDTARLRIDPRTALDALPHMICGLDVATARLTVAGLGIDTSTHAAAGAT